MKAIRNLGIMVLLTGVVTVILGAVFIGQGVSKNSQLVEAMRVEHVTLGIENTELEGQVIDTLGEAQKAGDTIREHRRGIAPSYSDLLGDGRFDPTDPKQLTYAQALNLENYLYLAVVAFGLTMSVTGSGVFMLFTGIGLGGTGAALYQLSQRLT
ncbi:hypothetical protein ACFLUZ_05240 [Chloroflexota bacterium]